MKTANFSITRVLVVLLVWALLPTLAALWLLQHRDYLLQYDVELEASLRASRRVGQSFANYVELLDAYETGIGDLAAARVLDANRHLATVNSELPAVEALHWLDPGGSVLFSSDLASIGTRPLGRELLPVAGDSSDVSVSDLIDGLSPNGQPAFAVTKRYPAGHHSADGYLAAIVGPRRLFEEVLLGPTQPGYVAVLFDSWGLLVAQFPNGDPTWEERDHRWDPLVVGALAGNEGQRRLTVRGADILEVRAPVEALGWVAGVDVDLSVAFAEERGQYLLSMLLSLFVSASSAAAAIYFSRRIASNVQSLRRHAKALEKGATEAKSDVPDIMEFAEVRAAFDEMAAKKNQSEQALKILAADLEASNRDLEQFAYMASHDLQEPVRMIKGFTDLLFSKHRDSFSGEALDFMSYIHDGATRMELLIRDLLAFSRVDREAVTRGLVDLEETVQEVLRNMSRQLEDAGATVKTMPLPAVLGNQSLLYQVFQNMISNAIKFREPQRALEISIGARKEGESWLMWVEDNGSGFPPEWGERIFEIFQRFHPEKRREGTGIGLAICKRVIERHGGRIWAKSEPGRGATFYFTLPAALQ